MREITERKNGMSEETLKVELLKCTLVVADDLPPGLAVNTAAVLAAALGKQVPALIGADLPDAAGLSHVGLVSVPLPILSASRTQIKQIREQAGTAEGLTVIDVTDPAQRARTYAEYAQALAETSAEALVYLGVALCGPKKSVTKFTGSLPLLR